MATGKQIDRSNSTKGARDSSSRSGTSEQLSKAIIDRLAKESADFDFSGLQKEDYTDLVAFLLQRYSGKSDSKVTASLPDKTKDNRGGKSVSLSQIHLDSESSNSNSSPSLQQNRRLSSESSTGTGSDKDSSGNPASSLSGEKEQFLERFLAQIYDRTSHSRSADSDTFTEASFSESFLSFVHSSSPFSHHRFRSTFASDLEADQVNEVGLTFKRSQSQLEAKSQKELAELLRNLQTHAQHVSGQLVRQLRRRDHVLQRRTRYCDVISAILQATSEHRSEDRNLKFTIEPQYSLGESAFPRWKDTMKAVVRLPCGLPPDFRRRMWLALADSHIKSIKVDWERTKRFAFNERQNPDDCALGLQIVKDLHRTGYSNFNGQDNEEDRAVLKRVLLGYARWNKTVGYCQGFNVIAALILDVVKRCEDEALKVFIYLIDHVLPESFFNNNLTALAVEMTVFRDLLAVYVPELSRHLEALQRRAKDSNSGNNYEPPLTNVFTMQWFLTLFATCLPQNTVLRLWDVILLEGCETLLRAALAVWHKLRTHIRGVHSADEFYCLMGSLSQRLLDNQIVAADELIRVMFTLCPSPIPNLSELREKYTYNITPFASTGAAGKATKAARKPGGANTGNRPTPRQVEDDGAFGCFSSVFPDSDATERRRPVAPTDISRVGPGAFADDEEHQRALAAATCPDHFAERMSTDVTALRKQYERLTERHRQAKVIITSAHRRYRESVGQNAGGSSGAASLQSSSSPASGNTHTPPTPPPLPPPYSNVINHLLLGSVSTRNRNSSTSQTPDSGPLHSRKHSSEVTKATGPAPAPGSGSETKPVWKSSVQSELKRASSLELLPTQTQAVSSVLPCASGSAEAMKRTCSERELKAGDQSTVTTSGAEGSTKFPPTAQSNETSLQTLEAEDQQKSAQSTSQTQPAKADRPSAAAAAATAAAAADRKPFNYNKPNPNSLQRIRKMNMNACLQRGYLADMHTVQQAQRRKLYS